MLEEINKSFQSALRFLYASFNQRAFDGWVSAKLPGTVKYSAAVYCIAALAFGSFLFFIVQDYITMYRLDKYGVQTTAQVISFKNRPHRTGKAQGGPWNNDVKLAYLFVTPDGIARQREMSRDLIVPPPALTKGSTIQIAFDRNNFGRSVWRLEIDDAFAHNYRVGGLFFGAFTMYYSFFAFRCLRWLTRPSPAR